MAASQVSRRSCTACDSRRLGSRPARVEGSTTPRPRCILHPARRELAQAAVEFYSATNTFSWASSGLVTCAARAGITPVPTEGSDGSSAGCRAASCAHEGPQLEKAEGVPQGSAGSSMPLELLGHRIQTQNCEIKTYTTSQTCINQ